jgi:hypothetical protein
MREEEDCFPKKIKEKATYLRHKMAQKMIPRREYDRWPRARR